MKNKLLFLGTKNPLRLKFDELILPHVPEKPGIYIFENADGGILHVGRVKNLKNSLSDVCSVDPLEVSRRRRKLLYTTEKVRWTDASDGATGQSIRTCARANRPDKFPYLRLRYTAHNKRLQLTLYATTPTNDDHGVQIFGPLKRLVPVYGTLLRLLWLLAESKRKSRDFDGMPGRFYRKTPPRECTLRCEVQHLSQMQAYLSGVRGKSFTEMFREVLLSQLKPMSFQHQVVSGDISRLEHFYAHHLSYQTRLARFHKLGKNNVPSGKDLL